MSDERQQAALSLLQRRKRNYQLALGSPAGAEILVDLADFCRAGESCFHPDARLHAVAEGRREVWLRIQNHLNLSTDELYRIATGHAVVRQQKEDTDDLSDIL